MTLNLQGELIPSDWAEIYRAWGFQSGFYCPEDIRQAIANLEAGEEMILEINSVGGVTDCAAEIYSLLAKCSSPTRAEIQSLAASAASYFPLACDRVEIALPAQMMIHCASWGVGGNKYDHLWAAQQLDATDSSILDVYCRKCGEKAEREQLSKLMDEETYLTAQQCLELGLVDAIIGDKDESGQPLAMVASIHNNTVRAMRTLPDIRDLMSRELEQEKSRYTT